MKNHLLTAMLIVSLAGAAQANPTPQSFNGPAAGVHEVASPNTGGIRPLGLTVRKSRRSFRANRGTIFNTGRGRADLGFGVGNRVRLAESEVEEARDDLRQAQQAPAPATDFASSGDRRVDSHDLELQESAFEEARTAYRDGELTGLELEQRLRFLDSYEGIESLRRQEAEANAARIAQAEQKVEEAEEALDEARAREAEDSAQEVVDSAETTVAEVAEAAEEAAEEVEVPDLPDPEVETPEETPEPVEECQVAAAAPPSTVVSDHLEHGLWRPFNDFELDEAEGLPGRASSSDWPSDGLDIILHLHDRGLAWTMIDRFLEAGATLDLVTADISDQGRYNPDDKAIKIPHSKYTNGQLSNIRSFSTTLAHEFWHAYYHQVVQAGYDPQTQEVFDEAVEWLLEQDLQKKDGNHKLPAVKASEITSWGFDDFEETDFMDEYIGALLNDLVLQHLSIQNRMKMAIEEGMSEDQALERARSNWTRALDGVKNSKFEAYEDADSGDYFVDAHPPADLVDHMVNLFNLGF